MLEMMSLLNAKSNIDQNDKLSSLMMSTMAAAAMQAAAANNNSPGSTNTQSNGSSSNTNSDDYCCILCGYKEQSVERLKDHINLHFIGQVKRKHESESDQTKNGREELSPPVAAGPRGTSPVAKKFKIVKTEEDNAAAAADSKT